MFIDFRESGRGWQGERETPETHGLLVKGETLQPTDPPGQGQFLM